MKVHYQCDGKTVVSQMGKCKLAHKLRDDRKYSRWIKRHNRHDYSLPTNQSRFQIMKLEHYRTQTKIKMSNREYWFPV